jgi:hypothetical protein
VTATLNRTQIQHILEVVRSSAPTSHHDGRHIDFPDLDVDGLARDVHAAIILHDSVQRFRTTASTKRLIKQLKNIVRLSSSLAPEVDAMSGWLEKHAQKRVEAGTSPDMAMIVQGIRTAGAAARAELRRARENKWAELPIAPGLLPPKPSLVAELARVFESRLGLPPIVSRDNAREDPHGSFVAFVMEVCDQYDIGMTAEAVEKNLRRARRGSRDKDKN